MSENVTKTKEQDGRKPGEDYRDADGIRSSDSPGPFILSLIFIKVPFPYLSVLCEQLRQVKWPVT